MPSDSTAVLRGKVNVHKSWLIVVIWNVRREVCPLWGRLARW